MMSMPTTILIYGRDAGLLETRQWLLERSGYRVLTTTEFPEVKRIVAEEGIDLLILCHSLSSAEAEEALGVAKEHGGRVHTLIMAAFTGSRPLGEPDVVIEAMDGPGKLISVVGKLLEYPDGAAPSARLRV
jgi:DNA-binding NtrC family response regulator